MEYTINSNFAVGDEVWSYYRRPKHYTCPVCEGNGNFIHNEHTVRCPNCCGTGQLHNAKQYELDVCRVKIRRMIASIWEDRTTIKYKVNVVIDGNPDEYIKITNRGECNLWRTKEEAEKYCEENNPVDKKFPK